jgi:short-subunit dehydrogenase
MMERRTGRIINIASIVALTLNSHMPSNLPYGAAKPGVIGFTKHLTKEIICTGVIMVDVKKLCK